MGKATSCRDTQTLDGDAREDRHMNLSVSWRSIAVGATCTAIALATALVVVSTQNDLDYLATLALALAVIAFVAQIIVFIAQTNFSSQQIARAEELHGLTARALVAIEEKAEGTRQTVNTINDRILPAALGKLVPDAIANGVPLDSAEFMERLDEFVHRTAAPSSPVAVEVPVVPVVPTEPETSIPTPRPTRRLTKLVFPRGQELHEALAAIDGLDGDALDDLSRLGSDYERYEGSPTSIGHGVRTLSRGRTLHSRGLVRKVRVSWEDSPVFVLTDLGRSAAAILRVHALPDDTPAVARELRAALHEYYAGVERMRSTGDGVPVSEDDDTFLT
jgi:hypothetical protein